MFRFFEVPSLSFSYLSSLLFSLFPRGENTVENAPVSPQESDTNLFSLDSSLPEQRTPVFLSYRSVAFWAAGGYL